MRRDRKTNKAATIQPNTIDYVSLELILNFCSSGFKEVKGEATHKFVAWKA